jgi:hypothetical protein
VTGVGGARDNGAALRTVVGFALCSCIAAVFGLLAVNQVAAQPCDEQPPSALRLTMPSRMVNTKSITLKAELLDNLGRIDWLQWDRTGAVSIVRLPDETPVAFSRVNFDTHEGTPPDNAIRFRSGVASVTLTLDNGAEEPAGSLEFRVNVGGFVDGKVFNVADAKVITVLDNPPMKNISGLLTGDNLNWDPDDGVIHVTGNATVASGTTLRIAPGTLIMVDAGPMQNGTRIDVNGALHAEGTSDDPVFFFPSAGADALKLMEFCPGVPYNEFAWRGIYHNGSGRSTYNHVFLTGAGNGDVTGHTRPPILRFQGAHSFEMTHSVMAFNNGKVIHGQGSGNYVIRDCLFTRCGHGGEFIGAGNYSLLVEDTWYTSIGHGHAEGEVGGEIIECNLDGDCMNIASSNPSTLSNKVVRGCVFTDSGDDGIDCKYTQPLIENCIFWHMVDKGVSMEGDGVAPMLRNLLIFDVHFATDGHFQADPEILGTTYHMENCTLQARSTRALQRVVPGTTVDKTIIWPNPQPTCEAAIMNYCYVGLGSSTLCGIGNVAADPLFVSAAAKDYQLQTISPARTAGPSGEQIGWLGFPEPLCPCLGELDLTIFAGFADCMSGPDAAFLEDCACFDFDRDGDIDLQDFQRFQYGYLE